MAKCSKGKFSRVKKDIISELPQNIQESILCFLPLRDAVRTSILSRKWRHCWTTIPHLIFDADFSDSLTDRLSQCDDPELIAYKFVSVINRILLLHNGSILNFSLRRPDEDCDAEIIRDYVDQWISLLSKKGTKQLTLENLRGEFPKHYFSTLDPTHLRLVGFWFSSTSYGGFPYLTNLELIRLHTSEQSIFDCPVLEKLTLVNCEGIFPNNFRAPKLRCLHQFSLDITKEYSLAGLENLTEYSFALHGDGTPVKLTNTCNVVEILSRLHKIEKFCAAEDFMQFLAEGGCPNRLSKPLCYLRTLNISGIYFSDLSEVSCLLCVIRSAPNLCTLNISAEFYEEDPEDCGCGCAIDHHIEGSAIDHLIEGSEDCAIDHLESITFSNFKGRRAELELVKFLLGHSPLLKSMSIHFHGAMKKDVALTVEEEVFQYFTASSRVQIRYLERPVDFDDFGAFF